MKLGILGTGMIVKDLLTTIHKIDFECVAILGTERTKSETEQLVETYHLNQAYYDYDEMLASDLDTIYVALPNFLHYSFAKKALLHGKHVIVEKPVTANHKEFLELKEIAEKQNRIMIEAMTVHFMPAYLHLKKDLSQLGNLKVISMNYSQYSSRYDAFKEGNILPAFDYHKAGGALMDINVYNIHFVVGLFGRPTKVQYHANVEKGIDTSGMMILDYETFKVVCIGAKDCTAPIVSTIQGDQGSIIFNRPANQIQSYQVHVNGKDMVEQDFDENENRLLYEFTEMIRIIEEKDMEKVNSLLEISDIVSDVMEEARKQEGIEFDNDK